MIHNKLEILLKEKKLTQKDVSEKSGLSVMAISAIMGGGDLKVSNLIKIANAIGVPVNYFFDESTPIPISPIEKHKSKTKVIVQIELDDEKETKVLKMVMGKEFIKLLK